MTPAIFGRGLPMTEEEFLALGETSERIELFDGGLLVGAAGHPRHQYIASEMITALEPAADRASLYLLAAVNMRLRPGRISIPDVAISDAVDFDKPVIDAESVKLVCEIVSPSSAAVDTVLKMHYYAAARIPRYLLVEQDTGTLHLHELVGDTYREQSVTRAGEVLHLTEPVEAAISPVELLPPS